MSRFLDSSRFRSGNPGGDAIAPLAADLAPVRLPRDELAHPQHDMEWWYFVAHIGPITGSLSHSILLSTIRGRQGPANFGLCFLKQTDHVRGPRSLIDCGQVFSQGYEETRNPVSFRHNFRSALGNMWTCSQASWQIQGRPDKYRITAWLAGQAESSAPDVDLVFRSVGLPALLGTDGVFDYGGGHKLAYYLRPRMEVEGIYPTDAGATRVRGVGWYERQWGDEPKKKYSWKYLNIHVDNGDRWLFFRSSFGGNIRYCAAYFGADGSNEQLPIDAANIVDVDHRGRPLGTILLLELRGEPVRLEVTPLFPDEAEVSSRYPLMPDFWEGVCRVQGTKGAAEIAGLAMTEIK